MQVNRRDHQICKCVAFPRFSSQLLAFSSQLLAFSSHLLAIGLPFFGLDCRFFVGLVCFVGLSFVWVFRCMLGFFSWFVFFCWIAVVLVGLTFFVGLAFF